MPGRIDGVARAVAGRGATGGGGGTPSASKRRAGDESKLDVDAGGLGAIGGPPRVLRRSDAGLEGARVRVELLLLRTADTAEVRRLVGGIEGFLSPPWVADERDLLRWPGQLTRRDQTVEVA